MYSMPESMKDQTNYNDHLKLYLRQLSSTGQFE